MNQSLDAENDELSEDDLGDVKAIENILLENNDLKEVMTSNNSEENKMSYLKDKFESALLDLVDKNIEMFNTLRDNQPAKNMIFQAIYRNYLNDLGTAWYGNKNKKYIWSKKWKAF